MKSLMALIGLLVQLIQSWRVQRQYKKEQDQRDQLEQDHLYFYDSHFGGVSKPAQPTNQTDPSSNRDTKPP